MRALVVSHSARLHSVAAYMLGDAALAEDVVQDVFVKALNRAGDWTGERARFSTWLHRVTVNACIDKLRKTRPATGMDFAAVPDTAPSSETRLINDDRRAALRNAMTTLPERQREAIALSLSGISQAEAADVLAITQSAYESLLVRARRHLRASVKETTHAV